MREIKFRAWNGVEMLLNVVGIHNGMPIQYSSTGYHHYVEKMPIMQYTGLVDKNGKEIYEGDIVLEGNRIQVVEWVDAGFNVLSGDHYKMIGNIYENPELLEDTKQHA